MIIRKQKLILWAMTLFVASLACSVSGSEPTEPAQSFTPTVNLTLTAVFSTQGTSEATQPPVVTASATSAPDDGTPEASATAEAMSTSTEGASESATIQPTNLPTRGFSPPPSNGTTTPYPGGGALIHAGPSVSAYYISPAPIIDGDYSDWASITYPISNVTYGSGYYLDSNDISGSFQVGWDATHLFIGIEVVDNKFVQIASGKLLYLGDSIEILIDSDISRDYDDTSLNFDDHQLGISPGSPLTGKPPEAYIWYPLSKRGPTPVVEMAVILTGTGYKIEAAIPWSLFGVFPAAEQHFGFAISISDNDAVDRYWQQTMVSNVPTRRLTDPTTWGDLVLIVP
ncbi:MAG: hypothetical protein IH859_03980 [Chloroflexi bacterium]|nr:hypothetical protein [Chloroflexota bacterium]